MATHVREMSLRIECLIEYYQIIILLMELFKKQQQLEITYVIIYK